MLFMITIFTDGSCDINKRGAKNIGGYAYVILNEYGIKIHEFVGKELNTTNNRMELKAVIESIKKVGNTRDEVLIHSDSQYVVNAINQKWVNNWAKKGFVKGQYKKDIPNRDLWEELLGLLRPNIRLVWVRGHNGNKFNEECDALASSVFKKDYIINKN